MNSISWIFLISVNSLLFFILKFSDNSTNNRILNQISIEQFKVYALLFLMFFIEYHFINNKNYNVYGIVIRSTLFSLYIYHFFKEYFASILKAVIDLKIIILIIIITLIFALMVLNFQNYVYRFVNLKSPELNGIYLSKYRLLIGLVSISILPALFEEVFYRGIIYDKLKLVYSNKNVVIISSLLFYFSHLIYGNIISIIYIFPIGLFLGMLRTKFNNLLYPIACHFFYNFIVFIYPLI